MRWWVSIALAASGCFGDPISKARTDVDETEVEETADASCATDAECAAAAGPCQVGTCGAGGRCVYEGRSAVACDDGDACTRDDVCQDGVCRGAAYVCDDGLACTEDVCDGEGGCAHPVQSGACAIDGVCVEVGEVAASDACQICEAGREWSPASGIDCEDGDACTTGDTCDAGRCVAGALPEDADGDWLVELANMGDATHELRVLELVATAGGGAVVALQSRGRVTLVNGWEHAGVASTPVLVGIDAEGAVVWAKAVEGATEVYALGENLARGTSWSARCHPCALRDLETGAAEVLATDEQRSSVVLAFDPSGVARSMAVGEPPQAMDALDQTYVVLDGKPEQVLWGATGEPVALPAPTEGEMLWNIIELDAAGAPMRVVELEYEPAVQTWEHGIEPAGRPPIGPDGRLHLPFVAAAGTVRVAGSSLSKQLESNSLVLLRDRRDEPPELDLLMSGLGSPVGFWRLAEVKLSFSPNAVIVGGYFKGQNVNFGTGADQATYSSSQYWGEEDSGNFGATGEGFVAKYVDGKLAWFRTLVPMAPPPATNELQTSRLGHPARTARGWVVPGWVVGYGGWGADGKVEVVPLPEGNPAFYDFIAEVDEEGARLWSTPVASVGIVASSATGTYAAGLMKVGANGIGPTQRVVTSEALGPPRVFVQRFNSREGLSCGVAP